MSAALAGRRILVTRPAAQAASLVGMIEAEGGEAVCFPLLEIAPVDDLAPLAAAAASLESYDFAIFISPNAVNYAIPHLLVGRNWPTGLPAVAIGPSTVKSLENFGVGPVLAPSERYDSEAVLALPALATAQVQGRRVLILRGNGGRELLSETLQARGATVSRVSCYQRSAPSDATLLRSRLRAGQLDALTLSSSEGLRYLWAMLDAEERLRLSALPLFVPHARIGEEATALGLSRVMLTEPADTGIVSALLAFKGFSST